MVSIAFYAVIWGMACRRAHPTVTGMPAYSAARNGFQEEGEIHGIVPIEVECAYDRTQWVEEPLWVGD